MGNPGRTRFGGLVGDLLGTWIVDYKGYIGYSTNIHAELEAVRCDLAIAWDRNIRSLLEDADCMDVIHLISCMKTLLQREWNVTISHTYREANYSADKLAKEAT
ncbi:hypothetical protein L6164_034677 [Bauhinia variegata]|uniref:Uncharacterized protein n=1 Tax=Bauhinia variegata TaxID=167791 RepID=A0ACB9KW69_BAUVA|nr:hypothetical protein L6164_034677 [Bauhinia variegata]